MDGRDEPQVDGNRRTRCAWAADAEETKGTQQRVNRCCSQTSLDRLDFALFLFLSSLYTGSSRHRVARLSTLFHVSLSLSLVLSLTLFFPFLFLFFTSPLSVRIYRLSSLRFPPSLHRTGFTFFFRGLFFNSEFRYLAGARPNG